KRRHFRSPEGSWRIVSACSRITDTKEKVPDSCVFDYHCSMEALFSSPLPEIFVLSLSLGTKGTKIT
ncbi:hypothetical protein KO465_07630, partial [Candidatus Micrarchaeota archaeon]|nr:hypothetical protein [Candidatus Micrarchaeota archaeon]